MSYHGWKNRETWLVNVWFGDGWAMMQDDGAQITPEFIRDEVETYVFDVVGVPAASFVADMLDLNAIDYDELAAHYAPEMDADVEADADA